MKIKLKILIPIILVLALGAILFNKSDDPTKGTINLKGDIIKNDEDPNEIMIGDREMVQIRFSWEMDGAKYNDALNIPKDQYQKLSSLDIERMKNERFQNWVNLVNEQSKLRAPIE